MASMLATPMITTLHTPPTPWLESALDVAGRAGTRFAAVSRHTANAWRHVASKVTVVPNGVDFRRWPLGPGGDNLVWFGRITAEKAPHLAIAAARRADLPLVLAGPVSDTAYFKRAVAPLLGDHVRYAGHLNHDELARLVGRSAAALVTPMWDEPYGLVVAEAMSCGTPVVAFARGGIPEIVSPQSGRLRPAKRRRSHGRRNTGSPVTRPNPCAPPCRRLLLGQGDGDRIPRPLPHDDRRSE
jgi:glycosyltransferase involved in cell wall biosynthesis